MILTSPPLDSKQHLTNGPLVTACATDSHDGRRIWITQLPMCHGILSLKHAYSEIEVGRIKL